jgi:LmbE family N-acetylglucosaminyl deacetylase
MTSPLRLACVFAHPDDETLGMGGTIARAVAEGIETHLVTATRGQAGRYRDNSAHPGPDALGRIREAELREAAGVLGVHAVHVLDYHDGRLDQADPKRVVADVVARLRAIRPHVVATFGPDGAYGHPDHIAISQAATAAVAASADPAYEPAAGPPHAVSKLYYVAWSEPKWAAYQSAFKRLVSRVDGVERAAAPWPDWAITTVVDTAAYWPTVWRAVQCFDSQMMIYGPLGHLSDADHAGLWGKQEFYRALSLVNGGRRRESDLFEGLR